MQKRILVQYALFSCNTDYWKLPVDERKSRLRNFVKDIAETADKTYFYQVYPAQTKFDFLVWTTVEAEVLDAPNKFMEAFARASNKYRDHITPIQTFWGMTKPSQYSKAKRSPQELDPYEEKRMPYFVIYPFTKTAEWYMKSREERQEMMNSHIKIGKSFPDITQLLLYSFGLQDQEFVVAYETEDLAKFSDLVYELRMTEARVYTLNDTPIITGMRREADELVRIFSGK
jgi:chlorite dismutase